MRYSWSRAVIVAMLAGCSLLLSGCWPFRRGGPTGQPGHPVGPVTITCPIDGLPTTAEAIARRPLAVMVENSPESRPQSGLNQACAVYEGITEGGITRFMALYLHGSATVIGPVRSARPHFIYLAQEYYPVFAHCGESYQALQILANVPYLENLDQLKYPKPFWRSRTRRAPHNLYTSTERLRAFAAKKGWERPPGTIPQFTGAGTATNGTPASEVHISFGGAIRYGLRFVYDATRDGYLRYMDGKLHTDKETGEPIVAHNILIQRVEAELFVKDSPSDYSKDVFDVRVIGAGEGSFVAQGQQMAMRWQKDTDRAVTSYRDAAGAALPFEAGQTWIELVPISGKVSFTTPGETAPAGTEPQSRSRSGRRHRTPRDAATPQPTATR